MSGVFRFFRQVKSNVLRPYITNVFVFIFRYVFGFSVLYGPFGGQSESYLHLHCKC
jgi:hypothetical protein